MSNELFQKYGYCEIPKGTILYRMGEIFEERGATFAFHPRCTMNFTHGSNKLIFAYETNENINVLFLVTHLNCYGFPVSGIEELYEAKVEPKGALDDIDIKHRNVAASVRFKKMLLGLNVSGWLTTIEGYERLEIFLLPSVLNCIQKRSGLVSYENQKFKNSLRSIIVKPSQSFLLISEDKIKKNYSYLIECSNRQSESEYGLFDKLFV